MTIFYSSSSPVDDYSIAVVGLWVTIVYSSSSPVGDYSL